MKLLKAMATVAGLTGVSRILGFVRDVLMAAVLGAGPIADAFFVALKLPNFFRRVTAEGAFSVSFVPLYSKKLAQSGQKEADIFASNAFAMMFTILSVFTAAALLAMPWIIYAIAPGFNGDSVRHDLAVEMSRVTFPYLLLMSLTALMGGVLNALDRFAPFAAAPILFNLCLIITLVVYNPEITQTPGHAMALGVLIAGILQLVWLGYSIRRAKVSLRPVMPKMNTDMKQLFALMGPGVVGAGVMHINLFADLIIASFLGEGSISYLYYADRLNQLPLGMVGIAVGTALLPMLSKALAGGDHDKAQNLFNRALEICLLLALPAAAALAVIPDVLIHVLFERGAFEEEDTLLTAQVLRAYALGLPAYIAVKVFSTAYWARQDTLTPVKISVITTALNIVMSLVLAQLIGVAGIALATGVSGWLQFALLKWKLKEQPAAHFDKRFMSVLPKIILSVFLMGAVLYGILEALSYAGQSGLGVTSLSGLILLVLAGAVSYAGSILLLRVVKIEELKGYLKRT